MAGVSVFESVLLEEYDRSQRAYEAFRAEYDALPRGSVRERIVRGRAYYYLQYRDGSRVKSQYVPRDEVDSLKRLIERRKQLAADLKALKQSQRQIERALGKEFISEHSGK